MKPAMRLAEFGCAALALVAALGAGRCLAEEPAVAKGSAPGPAPRMVVESPALELGDVVRGEEIRAEFRIRNEGEGDLRILRAKPG